MILITVLIGIIGLGIVVFVHEAGHFIVAKLCGVNVEVFSLGWGPKLVGFCHKGTTYQVSWLPLGGFCKMQGDDIRASYAEDSDNRKIQVGDFLAAKPLRRILIVCAGPVANVIFAVFVLSLIWGIGFSIKSPSNRIVIASEFLSDGKNVDSPAVVGGLKSGDRVLMIEGRQVNNFTEIREKVISNAGRRLSFTIDRAGVLLSTSIIPKFDEFSSTGKIGVFPWIEPVLEIDKSGIAADLGFETGDKIIQVNKNNIEHTIQLTQLVRESGGTVDLTVLRNDSLIMIPSVSLFNDNSSNSNLGYSFRLSEYRSPKLSGVKALERGVQETFKTIGITLAGFKLLFNKNNVNSVAGPLRITYLMGSAATSGFDSSFWSGFVQFFRLLSLISVVIAVMNLLPLPVLDGGNLVVYMIELIRGRPLSLAIQIRIQRFGSSIILALILLVTFSDLVFFITG